MVSATKPFICANALNSEDADGGGELNVQDVVGRVGGIQSW